VSRTRTSTARLPQTIVLASICLWGATSRSQTAENASASALVSEAAKYELEDFHHTSWGLRYRVHRHDDKEDSLRDLVESKDGNVSRTLTRQGAPLSAEEEAAERQRLERISAADMAKRRQRTESTDKFGIELIGALPQAMIYTPAPGQPQLPQSEHPQTVLDFVPNPHFHPSTTSQSVLPCLAGRVWIDAETHHLVRIEVKVVRNVNLMLGILARVYSGGTLTYEQHPVGGGHYGYTRIDIDVKLRELMVKVVPYRSTYTTTDVTYMPSPPSYKEAVKMLLTKP
jgi:hypothetical protein